MISACWTREGGREGREDGGRMNKATRVAVVEKAKAPFENEWIHSTQLNIKSN